MKDTKTYVITRNGEYYDTIVAIDLKEAKKKFAQYIADLFEEKVFNDLYEFIDEEMARSMEEHDGLDMRYYIGPGYYTVFSEKRQVFSMGMMGKGFERFDIEGNKYKLKSK